MKINMYLFNECLASLACGDVDARRKAVRGLVQIGAAEWEGTPDAVTDAVGALAGAKPHRRVEPLDGPLRAEAAKVLGTIGTRSPDVVPELLRLLQEDADGEVRTEAARALGKIGVHAGMASRALLAALRSPEGGELLRGEAARALARVDPEAPATAAALQVAAGDRSSFTAQ